MNIDYLTKQILTYMGNKRKLIPKIEDIIKDIKQRLNKTTLTTGDGFSGSGIVSRLLKIHSSELYVNDLAGYSQTINECYLPYISPKTKTRIKRLINLANKYVDKGDINVPKYISKYWAPKTKAIQKNDRVYFTKENAERIDKYRYFIDNIPRIYRPYLLAPLLIQTSIHNNTNGQFSAFYKKDGIGHFGGKNENDLLRITSPIILEEPILYNNKCNVHISRDDANLWVNNIPELDLVYYDPPYNKHPYNIYYFLLDIINDWEINTVIPDTYRGQPKNWVRSLYNGIDKAKKAFAELIQKTKAKYIVISYNNDGIISPIDMETILKKKRKCRTCRS